MKQTDLANGNAVHAEASAGHADPVVEYIHTMTRELSHIARAAGQDRLSLMLEMVSLEAQSLIDGTASSLKS